MSLLQKLEKKKDADKPVEEQPKHVVEAVDPHAEWKQELHGMIVDKLKNVKAEEKKTTRHWPRK